MSGDRSRTAAAVHFVLGLVALGVVVQAERTLWQGGVAYRARLGEGTALALAVGLGVGAVALVFGLLRAAGDHPVDGWRALRRAFQLVIIGWLVYLLGLGIYRWRDASIGLGLVGAVWGVAMALPPSRRRWPRVLDIVLFNLCVSALLLELGLRMTSALHPSPLLAQVHARVEREVERRRLRPGVLRFGFPVNDDGFYDEQFSEAEEQLSEAPADVPRVLVLGDSFSVGVVPHALHYTTLIEERLRVPLLNMGLPALGPHEYRYLLEHEGLALRPSAIVVALFVGNDLAETARVPTEHSFARRWLAVDNVLLVSVPRRLRTLARAREGGGDRLVGAVEDRFAHPEPIEEVADLARIYPWLDDPMIERPTLMPELFLRIEADRAVQALNATTVRFDALVQILVSMQALAGNVPFVVMLIPDQFQVEDALWRDVLDEVARRGEGALAHRDRPQRTLALKLKHAGVPVLDLLPAFRRTPAMEDGDRHLYHFRDTHWNRRGNIIAARVLGRYLEKVLYDGAEESMARGASSE